MTAAVFLDRDGTLIDEVGYLDRPERVALYPWSIDAIRALNRAGIRVIMVSNQSGIARGFFSEEMLDEMHQHLATLLAAGGARLDAYYYCPHHPDGRVAAVRARLRVPQARRRRWSSGPSRSSASIRGSLLRSAIAGWMSRSPARSARRGVLVRTGYGAIEETRPPDGLAADAVVDNLIEAVSWILLNRQRVPASRSPI